MLAEAKGVAEKMTAMKAMEGTAREHEEYRLRLENERGIRELVKAFNAEGMTGLKDPGINAQTWDLYRKVERDGALNVRVFALWRGGSSIDGEHQIGRAHV